LKDLKAPRTRQSAGAHVLCKWEWCFLGRFEYGNLRGRSGACSRQGGSNARRRAALRCGTLSRRGPPGKGGRVCPQGPRGGAAHRDTPAGALRQGAASAAALACASSSRCAACGVGRGWPAAMQQLRRARRIKLSGLARCRPLPPRLSWAWGPRGEGRRRRRRGSGAARPRALRRTRVRLYMGRRRRHQGWYSLAAFRSSALERCTCSTHTPYAMVERGVAPWPPRAVQTRRQRRGH
jgi:hypothetical protein